MLLLTMAILILRTVIPDANYIEQFYLIALSLPT
jgi:hypothetical protein